MASDYTLYEDLNALIGTAPSQSIVSRTIYKTDRLKAVLFGFDAGQELSEHTSSLTAVVQIVQGEATVTVGSDAHELRSGSWLLVQPHVKHSVYARTPMIMLLTMSASES